MRSIIATAILLLLSTTVSATSVMPKPLKEIVAMSDHIFIVKVEKVDLVNFIGFVSNNPEASTGPGRHNTISLHVKVLAVIKTNADPAPKHITVNLWGMWHYSLDQVRKASLNSTVIFLLEGKKFTPVYPGYFQQSLSDAAKIKRLVRASKNRK